MFCDNLASRRIIESVLLPLALFVLAIPSGRQVINLNEGWEYARVPTPPSIWSGIDAVPTSSWRVVSVSSEETKGEDGRAINAFDGNPKTIWHTEWSKREAPFPHELVIDLGTRVRAIGIRILPRQTSPNNGKPNHFELYISDQRATWGNPLLTGAIPDSTALFTHEFAPTTGRFLRLVFKDGHRSEPFLSLSEIGLIRDVNLKDQKDWASQYNIATVQVGGDSFDISGQNLERTKQSELRTLKPRDWQSATLPHAAWVRPLGTSQIWQGVAYYRRKLDLPATAKSKIAQLTLEGALQCTDLWLNGKHIATRRGGYLPLISDLNLSFDHTNELVVRVDNRDNPLIPPGKPQQDLDFMYGNGIYRNAFLTLTNKVRITDSIQENLRGSGGIYVTYPVVTPDAATVRIRTHVRNSANLTGEIEIRQALVNEQNRTVATGAQHASLRPGSAKQFLQDLNLLHPNLWFPDTPHLYRLTTSVLQGGKLVDQVTTQIGVRKVEVSLSRGFVINGKPLRLIGTNRHQDYPWVGPALSDAANIRDAILIRQAGHNIVRLSHYPQSPEFLDACDRLGLMTIPCIPGWQFMNKDQRFVQRVYQDIRELIRRDRNHPCAVFWETSLNETYPPVEIAREWNKVAKSEAQESNILTAGDAGTGAPWDVAYNQWRDDLSRPQDASASKPGYIREYGDYEFGGAYSSSRVRIGDGMPKLLQEAWNHVWSDNKFRPQYPWTMGNGTWEMFDTNVPWEFRVSACGLADLFRRPKPSFWFFQSQTAYRPMVKVAATWQPGPRVRDIVVFTNCDEARLTINGQVVSTQKPARTRSTTYDACKPFDGTNTENLPHPPIVFRSVPFSGGELKVLGYRQGRCVGQDSVKTAGKPTHLRVWVDDLGVRPQTNDLVFVRAALVDAKGIVNPDVVKAVRFSVNGANSAGEKLVSTEMGVASFLVRTADASHPITVRAATTDSLQGTVQFYPVANAPHN